MVQDHDSGTGVDHKTSAAHVEPRHPPRTPISADRDGQVWYWHDILSFGCALGPCPLGGGGAEGIAFVTGEQPGCLVERGEPLAIRDPCFSPAALHQPPPKGGGRAMTGADPPGAGGGGLGGGLDGEPLADRFAADLHLTVGRVR